MAIRPEPVLNSRVGEFVGRVIHGQKNQWLQVWMSGMMSALNQRGILEKVCSLLCVTEGYHNVARGSALKTTHSVGCDADLTEAIKQLFRRTLLWHFEMGRTRPVRGYVQRVKVLTFKIRQQAELTAILTAILLGRNILSCSLTSGPELLQSPPVSRTATAA